MKQTLVLAILIFFRTVIFTQDTLPVRGLCISLPNPSNLERFIGFIQDELGPRRVNTLILMVDYNYKYQTHPELVSKDALDRNQVERILNVCRSNGIRAIPQINLFGHQSWHSQPGKLLEIYPGFDETPHIQLPEKYVWPNEDELYCKSYCPLHPDLHGVLFEVIDEITEVFGSTDFHGGMDEVFYIADPNCPRCQGLDPALLFAGEVNKIRDHLAQSGKRLWIWGDRLLDGKLTGMGMWEASENGTYPAIDMIPKDIVICDWHYERPDPTAVYFAMKGFSVATCSWRNSQVALQQNQLLQTLIAGATPPMKERYLGMIETVWSPASDFLDQFYHNKTNEDGVAVTFRALFPKME